MNDIASKLGVIEKGVQPPKRVVYRKLLPKDVVMEIGDSVKREFRWVRALRAYGTRRGWVMAWEKQEDGEFRIWRIK
jgi:hypothetical protein